MKLELEPIESECALTEEQIERIRQRTRTISKEELSQFSESDQDEIKHFLTLLIVLSEHLNYDSKFHAQLSEEQKVHNKANLKKLNEDRKALFEDPPPFLKNFIELLDLCPMEAWVELEMLIKIMQKENLNRYKGVRQDADLSELYDHKFMEEVHHKNDEEEGMALKHKVRMTPLDIENLVLQFSLEELVKYLIYSRKVGAGMHWQDNTFTM